MKIVITAIALAAAAVALSGCIMYVAPDHDGWTYHHDHHDHMPAPDEKPADTMPANPA